MSLDNTFYAPAISSLAEAKAMALEQLAKINEAHQLAGVIVDSILASPPASEAVFATDAGTRQSLWAIFRALEKGTFASSYWVDESGVPHELLPSSTDDFCMQAALGITDYVSDCQINADTLTTAINAAASIDAVLNIDLSAGWPSRTLAGGLTFTEGGGGGCQIDEYTTAGTDTWTKPAGAVSVMVELIGAGGGGASGVIAGAGVVAEGGAGGGGGGFSRFHFDASELDASCTVTVGAGGTGATGDGVDGSDGGYSSFEDATIWVAAYGGGAGLTPSGGVTAGGFGGNGAIEDSSGAVAYYPTYTQYSNLTGMTLAFGPSGGAAVEGHFGGAAHEGGGGGGGISADGHLNVNSGSSLANCQFGGGPSVYGGGGGGAGGSVTAGDVPQRGGNGGKHGYQAHTVTIGNATGTGANGAAGTSSGARPFAISNGGGGGDAASAANGGNGGSAARGGGGGGGAGARTGYTSGNGGDGGDGYVRVTTWF